MKKADSPFGADADSPVADPDLPAHVRGFLQQHRPRTMEIYGDPDLPQPSALGRFFGSMERAVRRYGVPLGVAWALWWGTDRIADRTASADPASGTGAWHWMASNLATFTYPALVVATASVVCLVVCIRMADAGDDRRWREVQAARDRFVLPSQLTSDAAALLQRARAAADNILRSEVHTRDLIDRQRTEVQLPATVWEAARSLAQYSRLTEQAPDQPVGDSASSLVKAWHNDLAAGLTAIEQQVEALEVYAAQTAEADARLEELQQVGQLEKDSSDLLDFLASTLRAERAVEGIDEMTKEASAVADRFTTALIAAKNAAQQALPAAAAPDSPAV